MDLETSRGMTSELITSKSAVLLLLQSITQPLASSHYTLHHQLLLLLLHPPQQLLTHHIPLTKQPSTYSPWICNGSTDSIEIHPCEP